MRRATTTLLLFVATVVFMPRPVPAESGSSPPPVFTSHQGTFVEAVIDQHTVVRGQPPIPQSTRVIVRFRPGARLEPILGALRLNSRSVGRLHRTGAEVRGRMAGVEGALDRTYTVSLVRPAELEAAVQQLRAHPDVEFAEPNGFAVICHVPTDPLYPQQWSHQKTHAETAWDVQQGDAQTVIAIIDTGVRYDHEDLRDNIWRDGSGHPGKDFVDIDTAHYQSIGYTLSPQEDYTGIDDDPQDYHGHGTHVSGIAAARADNGCGVAGVSPGCRIMPVRAGFTVQMGSTYYGLLENDDIAQAIVYAADQGARVINMSFAGYESTAIRDAVNYAAARNVVLVAAAGNDQSQHRKYPAAYDAVIAVAATAQDDSRAWYSNHGYWIDLCAPGGSAPGDSRILSTVPTSGPLGHSTGYAALEGTSMACPYVAGAAALVIAENPAFSPEGVREVLLESADLPNSTDYLGRGRVNLFRAISTSQLANATARITQPADGDNLRGTFQIIGTASGASYLLEYGVGNYPAEWTPVSSGGSVDGGVLGTLNADDMPQGLVAFRLTVTGSNGTSVRATAHVRIDKYLHPGWPRNLVANNYSGNTIFAQGPVIADLNNDRRPEIVVAGVNSRKVFAFQDDGTQLQGWPRDIYYERYGISVADIDHDAHAEVFIHDYYDRLYLWRSSGVGFSAHWPLMFPTADHVIRAPILVDLDGAGAKEICFAADGKYHVLDASGSAWSPAWPLTLGGLTNVHPAVGDLDRDGFAEIVIGTVEDLGSARNQYGTTYGTRNCSLSVIDRNGQAVWSKHWPAEEGSTPRAPYERAVASVALADVDADHQLEIVVVVTKYDYYYWSGWPQTGHLFNLYYVIEADGTVAPGWPVQVASFGWRTISTLATDGNVIPLAVGNLDTDKELEIIGEGLNSTVHAWNHDGSLVFSTALRTKDSRLNPVAIADVNGDGRSEIVTYSWVSRHYFDDQYDPRLVALTGTGELIQDSFWPKTVGYAGASVTPAVADIDADGQVELVLVDGSFDGGSPPMVRVWDLAAAYHSARMDWPQFQQNPAHTGVYPLCVAPDFDHDRDVDGDDCAYFISCMTGAAVAQADGACRDARLDGDEDVDQSDFGILQRCFSGAGQAADPTCAG